MADQQAPWPGPAGPPRGGPHGSQPPGSQPPGPPGARSPGARSPGPAGAQSPGLQWAGRQSAGAGAAGGGGAGEVDLAVTVADLRAQVARLEDAWRRALADLDNLRKRAAREAGLRRAEERARVAAEWLPVVDNLELALEHAGPADGAIADGVRAVRDQAVAVLARLGFPRRDDLGARFDPARHEAVAAVPDPGAPPGTVVRLLRPGYGDGEHLLRPAAVVVATPPAAGSG